MADVDFDNMFAEQTRQEIYEELSMVPLDGDTVDQTAWVIYKGTT
jgi:hypothetical protein